MKKKILYISVYDPHVPYTGAGTRGGEFVNNLSNYFILDLIYLEGAGLPGNRNLENKFDKRIQNVNKKIKIPFSLKDYFLYSSKMINVADEFIKSNNYDILIADYGISAYYGLMFYKKYKLPFIYSSHNIEHKMYLGRAKKDFRRYFLLPWVYYVEKAGVKKSKLVISISQEDAEIYSKWTNSDKIQVIPQCFNEKLYNPHYKPQKNDPRIVLFFGNYNIAMNRDAVYTIYNEIMPRVVSRYPNVKFQFIGANPPKDIIHSNIEFLGFVENLHDYIKKCDVVISPIISGWGMPTKIVESLACGKPIVATKVAARTISEKYKTLNIASINNFPDAIVLLLTKDKNLDNSDFELLKQEFTWSSKIKNLAEKINNII